MGNRCPVAADTRAVAVEGRAWGFPVREDAGVRVATLGIDLTDDAAPPGDDVAEHEWDDDERRTYLLIDGENLDATLGVGILERRPRPDERPRWERVLQFAREQWGQPVTGLFFLAARHELPMAFVQALISIGFRPIPLTGRPDEKVVDMAISKTLQALKERDADVMLGSHDGDFLPDLGALCDGRRTGVIAFQEFRSQGYRELVDQGLEFFDLEYDVKAFDTRLPRVRIIPIEEFDPLEFI